MFFVKCSTYEGDRAKLYRSPESIREDISEIKTKIDAVNSMLNVRNILMEMIDATAHGEPENWIPLLSEIVCDAEDSLHKLKTLKESLDILSDELEDTRWVLGI